MATPEGVTLEVSLAGIGSRLAAAAIDQMIRLLVLFGLMLLVALFAGATESAAFVVAGVTVAVFVVQFGYDIVFETYASGQTPGKRWTGLRVLNVDGSPIGFKSSAVRNVVRIVDFLPAAYLVGMVSVFLTARNQRLGDLAAGAIVVTERHTSKDAAVQPWAVRSSAATDDDADLTWDVSAVTNDEIATVRRFLDRRATLTPESRSRLGADLAARLHPKVAGQPDDLSAERFLEALVAVKVRRQ